MIEDDTPFAVQVNHRSNPNLVASHYVNTEEEALAIALEAISSKSVKTVDVLERDVTWRIYHNRTEVKRRIQELSTISL